MDELKPVDQKEKSITDLSISDVAFRIDRNKSYDKQAEEVVGAIATAKAVEDKRVAKELTDRKAEELRFKAEAKSKEAEKESLDAEIKKQSAQRELYESVLQMFGITTHLPRWLMRLMVFVLSPIYVILTLVIGVPFGLVKTVIDNADNVLCRFEKVDTNIKPHLKVTVWVLLALVVLTGISVVVLKIFNKI